MPELDFVFLALVLGGFLAAVSAMAASRRGRAIQQPTVEPL